MRAQKTYYLIGVYDPKFDDCWPWHFQYEYGQYLSEKHRICKWERVAKFNTKEEAREFYSLWKHWKNYKFELIDETVWIEEPDPIYPPEHPRSILDSIIKNEPYSVKNSASLWFYGEDVKKFYSEGTLKKHRKVLLKYGIDIFVNVSNNMKISPILAIQEPVKKKPHLTVVK